MVVGFDLDMTLVDSRPGIATTLHALSAETGVAIDADVVVNRLGPALEVEMAEWFTADRVADVSDRYRELYSELGVPGTFALPGAFEAVEAVRRAGGRTIVVTAKFEPNAHLCLGQVCLDVDVVVGRRHGPGKTEALVEHGAAVYVGDTPPDMAAARAADAVAVGVTTGPHAHAELLDAGADIVLSSLRQFPAWFDAWRRGGGGGGASAAVR
jgi:phosphoglycolate phosphatase